VGLRIRRLRPFGKPNGLAGDSLGLPESPCESLPHATPRQRRVTVERLVELLGEHVELGLATTRLIQVAHLGEVVEQPVAPQRTELDVS